MVARNQNRTIILLFFIVISVVLYFALQSKDTSSSLDSEMPSSDMAVESDPNGKQTDKQSSKVDDNLSPEDANPQTFKKNENPVLATSAQVVSLKPIMAKVAECFGVVPRESNSASPVDFVVENLRGDLGEPSATKGRYMNWTLRDQTGREKQVRLQLNEVDQVVTRELFLYQVTDDGQFIPTNLSPEFSENPTDEAVNELLKSGEVQEVEKATLTTFPNGEEFFYVEKNGELAEFELVRGTTFFQCDAIKLESCRCIK